MKKLILTMDVRPGQAFQHYGLHYVRATDEEALRHPCRDMPRRQGRELVLAYQGEGDSRQPVTFVPDLAVNIEVGKKKRGKR